MGDDAVDQRAEAESEKERSHEGGHADRDEEQEHDRPDLPPEADQQPRCPRDVPHDSTVASSKREA